MTEHRTCSKPGCDGRHIAQGLCRKCYDAWRRNSAHPRSAADATIYGYGGIRLPRAAFPVGCDVIVSCERPGTIRARPAKDTEVGLRPKRPSAGSSPQLDIRAIFRRLHIDPARVAGRYHPDIINDEMVLELRT